MRTFRRAAALVAASLVAGLLTGIAPAAAEYLEPGATPAGVVRSGLGLTTAALCGDVYLVYSSNTADQTLLSRLPLTVSVSEPSRNLPKTPVVTLQPGNLGSTGTSTTLFTAAPSGRGPGLVVTLDWAGGTETIQTEAYVDNCPGVFFPVTPTRLLDTRTGQGTATGMPAAVAANTTIVVDSTTSGVVPPVGVTALALNVTATEPQTAGYLTVYPCGQAPPNASNLNFAAGQTVPNLVVVDLVGWPATGTVCIFSSSTTQILADVTGVYMANGLLPGGSRLNSLPSPQRVLDTRATTKVAAGTVRRVPMTGVAGIPATGVSAVSMNITAVNGAAAGFLTAFPCDQPQPNASNVNFIADRPVPNAAIVGLSADGALCVFASQTVDVLIDVSGYLAATGLLYYPTAPTRLWDNRTQAFSGEITPRKLPAAQYFRYNYGRPNVLLLLNITAVDEEASGFITVYPCDQGLPNASNLNFQPNEAIANTVTVKTDNSGLFCVYTTARLNFIIDINGLGITLT